MNEYPVTIHNPDGTTSTAFLVTDVSLQPRNLTLVPAPNGTMYSAYFGGNPPTPTIANIPNLLAQAASLSINLLTLYVTPNTGVTLVLNGTLPTGWAFDPLTNLLIYNGTSVSGPLNVSITATVTATGASATSNTFSLSGVGSVSADVNAPTVPVGVAASAVTTTAATLSGFPSSDPAPAGKTWSGLQQYNVAVTGAPGSPFTVSSSAGNKPTLTHLDIGPQTSTITQSGADVAFVTTALDAPYPTNSALACAYQQLTGTSWVLSCKVSSFSSSNAYSNVRMEARTNLTTTGPYVAIGCNPFSQGQGVFSEFRAAIGGNATGVRSVANSASPIWLFLVRSGDTYSFYYSLDGNTLIALGSQTQAMGNPLYVLVGANSSDGTTVSATVQQFNIQTLANWTLNLTGLTANTNYPVSVTAQDGASNVSAASASMSFTTASTGKTWPQLGAYLIGGSRLFNSTALKTYMKHLDFAITGCFDGWEASTGGTQAAFTTDVQANSLMPNGTKFLSYFDPVNLIVGSPAYTVQAAHNMMLVSAYSSNLTITSNGSYKVANLCTVGSQPTVTSGTPSTARNANTYMADYQYDFTTNGGALGLAGNSVAANTTVNGYFIDDFNCYPIAGSGDYLRNNTTQSGGQDSTTPQALALRQGFATYVARLKSNKPGALVFANLAGMYSNPLTTGIQGILDGGIAEHAMGDQYSSDTQSGWQSMMTIRGYQYNVCKAGATILFIHYNVTDSGQDSWRTSPGQAVRYGLASALMGGCPYAVTPTGSTPNTSLTSAFSNNAYDTELLGAGQWFDEFSVNPTTLVAYAYGDANIAAGMHWMGTEIDTGMVTTEWLQGVIRKRYQMTGGRQCWVLLNPKGNGSQTISLPQRMMAISGTQVPSVNNGSNNVTSVTIPDSDARFLITYP